MKAKQFLMISVILLAGMAFAQQVDSPGPKRVQLPEAVAMSNLTEVAIPHAPDDLGHITSKVVLRIVIDQQGNLAEANLVSGHPMLAAATIDAVKQWKFRPYLVNNVPVEVETTATIEFTPDAPYVITPKPRPIRMKASSGVLDGLAIHKVQPQYPMEARAKGIRGEVILAVRIGRDGNVTQLVPISGDPILIEAAVQAVRQWKYKPYLVNGEPVEVESLIHIRFQM